MSVRRFPSTAIDPACGGMELRDWFAGQALSKLPLWLEQAPGIPTDTEIAERCYAYADAMIAEREKGRTP